MNDQLLTEVYEKEIHWKAKQIFSIYFCSMQHGLFLFNRAEQ